MILGFKEHISGKPTYFKEKILANVANSYEMLTNFGKATITHAAGEERRYNRYELSGGIKKLDDLVIRPKIHTIREDKHDRWKAGRNIQMVYRGPKYSIKEVFNKDIPQLQKCVSTQKVEFIYEPKKKEGQRLHLVVNGIIKVIARLYQGDILMEVEYYEFAHTFAVNDGFDDFSHMLTWFNKDFSGKIIHFTEFRY